MLLAIDSGNSNTVFAVFSKDGEIQGEWRAAGESNRTSDEFGIWLTQLLDQEDIDRKKITLYNSTYANTRAYSRNVDRFS